MTTPLQQAAQAVIDRWESPLWKDQTHTGVYIAELRKALDAELAQSVEPEGYVLVPAETLLSIKGRVNTLATLSLKADRYSVGIAIKQTIADILAAQGEKP